MSPTVVFTEIATKSIVSTTTTFTITTTDHTISKLFVAKNHTRCAENHNGI